MEKAKDIPRGFRLIKELPGGIGISKLAWSASGSHLASVSSNSVRVWNVESSQSTPISRPDARPLAITWSPDEQIAVGWSDGKIEIREIVRGGLVRDLPLRRGPVVSLAWSPNGKMLASGTDIEGAVAYQLFCWDADTWSSTELQPRHANAVSCLSWSSDSMYLISGSHDYSTKIWDAGNRKLIRRLMPNGGGELNGAGWFPDGTLFVTSSHRDILIWNVTDEQPIRRLTGHEGVVTDISVSQQSPVLIATKSLDGTVRLWDTMDWRELALLIEPSTSTGLAFHPNSFRLATPSSDTAIRIWDLEIDALYGRTPKPLPGSPVEIPSPEETQVSAPVGLGTPIRTRAHRHSEYDIAIVCALVKPELEKVKKAGGGSVKWSPIKFTDDPQFYHHAEFRSSKNSPIRVIAAAPSQMGMANTAVLATKMIYRFLPKCIIMVGIAAGTKKEGRNFGDILAALKSYDYGAGKITDVEGVERFIPDYNPIPIDPMIHHMLREWENSRHLDEIKRNWPSKTPDTTLKLHLGPVASGAAVVDSGDKVKQISEPQRKLIGIEMEIYGLYIAATQTITPSPYFIAFKSVCDFAEEKDDSWQDYAAYTAAEFCYRFIIHDLWDEINKA